jgi:hypothetical protein
MAARFHIYERVEGTMARGTRLQNGLIRIAVASFLDLRGYEHAAAYLIQDADTGFVVTGEDFLEDNPLQAILAAWQGRPADGDARRAEIHTSWPNLGAALDNLENWLPMSGETPGS